MIYSYKYLPYYDNYTRIFLEQLSINFKIFIHEKSPQPLWLRARIWRRRELIIAIIYTFKNRYKYCQINVYIALLSQCKMLKLQKQHIFGATFMYLFRMREIPIFLILIATHMIYNIKTV